uniref:Uncharacterized protein n=1 Tax=Anguilla anguilla TaxID=7936 RepID=A0A0E9Q6G0_ANGAN
MLFSEIWYQYNGAKCQDFMLCSQDIILGNKICSLCGQDVILRNNICNVYVHDILWQHLCLVHS